LTASKLLLTPKALDNFSPGLLQPWETKKETRLTLKALANTLQVLPTPSALVSFVSQ
jgi:hypothetical protein